MLSVNVNLPVTVLNKGDVAMWLPWWWWWWWWWCDGWRPLWRGGMSDIHLDDRRQPRLVKLSLLIAFLSFAYLHICVFAYYMCFIYIYVCHQSHYRSFTRTINLCFFFAEFHIEMKCWAPCMFHSVCNVAPAPYLKSYQIEIWQFGEFNVGIGSRCRCNQWISVNGVEFETPIGLEPQTRAQFILFLKSVIKFLSLY